tara:strand:+ start:1230 stop:4589 length:3360 start_codon:yes stop_codon:yes gene_type:complete
MGRLNEDLIDILNRLTNTLKKRGENFKSRAYENAESTLINYPGDINSVDELKGVPTIGEAIFKKLKEYELTGKIKYLEELEKSPINTLTDVHGIGAVKAKSLINKGITTINKLREVQDKELNETQKKGLKYYDDLQLRIPKEEIQLYDLLFRKNFDDVNDDNKSKFVIAGSYRRGAKDSGDIDIAITNDDNNKKILTNFINNLYEKGVIIEFLTKGSVESFVIVQLPGKPARRLDIYYGEPDEYPFLLLYFTGSKQFNVGMRLRATKMGYTLNQKGLYYLENKKKGKKVENVEFKNEKDIFNFLSMKYKEPEERINAFSVQTISAQDLANKNADINSKPVNIKEELSKILNQKITKKIKEESKQTMVFNQYNKIEKYYKSLKKNNSPNKIKEIINDEPDDKADGKNTVKKEKEEISQEKTKEKTKEIIEKAEEKTKIILKNKKTKNKTMKVKKEKKEQKEKKEKKPKNKTMKQPKEPKEAKKPKQKPIAKTLIEAIQKLREDGIDVLNKFSEKKLNKLLIEGSKSYYNEQPFMTDNEYDIIKEYIEKKYPKNTVVENIGAPVEKNKVKLPYFMGSMDKIKPDTDALEKWKKKYGGDYVISGKLDGVSGLYTTENEIAKLYTRGNGIEGQDVSHLIPYLNLPKENNIVVRGEFIIEFKKFQEKYKDKFSNPRNFVSGVINSKNINKEHIKDIDFVAYELIKPELKPSEQMNFLEKLNIKLVKHIVKQNIDNKYLSEELVSFRETYKYQTDGIIVVDDNIYERKNKNPEHAFAFKMVLSEQVAEAKVLDVLWTPSKDGLLKPKIKIEPIRLGGVKIEYATAFNAGFVEKNKLGVGSVVKLVRSGDVIPHIMEVIQSAELVKWPDVDYDWNASHVDIILKNKSENEIVKTKNITGFFTTLGIKQVGPGNIERIIKGGYDDVCKILAMSKEDLLKIEGFKEKSATNIYTNIKEKMKDVSLSQLMDASNIFGQGFGEKRFDLILNNYSSVLTSEETKEEKMKKLVNIKGVSSKIAEAFLEHIKEFIEFLERCKLSEKLVFEPKSEKIIINHELYGKNIVITGFRDKDLENKLKDVGANISSSISKNTFVVVIKSLDEITGKVEKAKEKNIPIMELEKFKEKYLK